MSTANDSLQWQDLIDYPETDGHSVGETDVHAEWTLRLRDILKRRYRDQRVYVAGDMMLYYVRGYPSRSVAPDSFVVFDCEPRRRRVFKVWEEQRVPNVVFEVSSQSTCQNDLSSKLTIHEDLGVAEYFLYDPEATYLDPPLQGYRLINGIFTPIQPVAGRLDSQELGVQIFRDGNDLVLVDTNSGKICLTGEEVAESKLQERERELKQQEEKTKEQELQLKEQERKLKEQEREMRKQERNGGDRERPTLSEIEAEIASLSEELARLKAEQK